MQQKYYYYCQKNIVYYKVDFLVAKGKKQWYNDNWNS